MNEAEAMQLALVEARRAGAHGDVPVGAVVLFEDEVVCVGRNEREVSGDPTAHAELLAISAASAVLGRGELTRAVLIVTLEPCVMCGGGIRAAGIAKVVVAAMDEKAGACGSRYNLLADPRLGPEVPITIGTGGADSAELLRSFFAARRGSA